MGTGKKPTDFDKDLIWNTDEKACFLPEEFSNARISSLSSGHFVITVCLKNGEMITFHSWPKHFSKVEEAKKRLKKLMSEIGEKRERWKYKQMRPQKG